MTLFLLFSTFFLIKAQQDGYNQERHRRRRRPSAPVAPDSASVDVVYVHCNVGRALWLRGPAGTGPVLLSAFTAYLPEDGLLPAAAAAAAAAAGGAAGAGASGGAGGVGDEPPYKDRLDVIDIASGYHEQLELPHL
ncbi:hypothetical protein, conserved [Eimeria tenella]|uniref:Uncharacterized protein n=1 Tax=Eimeria tenella TaxID=5802 RepID=U6KSY3_EIMTE|nr:hypothetical protein, conserved [Eimeria tenella]CDJ38538.1 hypothetical protein, conserved [Eimeria tenella]|eukprot:XP_013229376.1 hypothetical protein, conserved [Eimeria tenella]